MSVMILDMIAEYTDRSTGNRQIRAQLIADTVTDLPSNTASLTYLLGSYAKVVDTGKEYYIDSSGTWIEQPSGISLDLSDYYTKTETDTLLSGKQDALTAEQLKVINNIIMTDRNVYVQGSAPSGVIPLHSTWINGKTIKEYVDETDTPSVSIEQGSFETFSGAEIPSATRVRTTMPSEISPPGTYTVDISGADDAVIYVYDEDHVYSEADSFISWDSMPRTFTISSPFYIRYAFRHSDNSNIVPSDVSGLTVNFEGWV